MLTSQLPSSPREGCMGPLGMFLLLGSLPWVPGGPDCPEEEDVCCHGLIVRLRAAGDCPPVLSLPPRSCNPVSLWTEHVGFLGDQRKECLDCPSKLHPSPSFGNPSPAPDDHLMVYLLVYGKDFLLTCVVCCDGSRSMSLTIHSGFLPWALPFAFGWLKFHRPCSCE